MVLISGYKDKGFGIAVPRRNDAETHKVLIADCSLQITDHRLQITDHRSQPRITPKKRGKREFPRIDHSKTLHLCNSTNQRLNKSTDCRLQITDHRIEFLTTNHQSPDAGRQSFFLTGLTRLTSLFFDRPPRMSA
jgi:hypothetical protein